MKFYSVLAATTFGSAIVTAKPTELSKRATYTFEVNSGQLQKCAPAGPTVNCVFQTCWVPRLTDQDGQVIAGAATKEDKDWKCASIDDAPEFTFFNIKYTEVGCDKPFTIGGGIGGGISFCTDGDGGKTAHFPNWVLDGK
ncbi:hypothetical protein IL306_002718 [Fusarium sp. DS 682]|nr:hypothetical protein IL306_002718 [Fusarium sp. DS 682]